MYSGSWQDDNKHGQGVQIFENGDEYSGSWNDGKRNGEGNQTYRSGDVYSGFWKNDFRHGEGVHKYREGQCINNEILLISLGTLELTLVDTNLSKSVFCSTRAFSTE